MKKWQWRYIWHSKCEKLQLQKKSHEYLRVIKNYASTGFNKNIDLCEHIRSESCRRNRLLRWGITSRMRFTNSVNQLYKHEDIKNDDKHEQKYLNRPIEVTKPVDRRLLKDLFYARTNITESTKYFSNKQQYLSLLILDFCSSRQWPKVRELSSVTEFSVT